MNLKLSIVLILHFLGLTIFAQEDFTISGYITDAATGETLIGANVFLADDPSTGTSTNAYGYYVLIVPKGKQILTASNLGYQDSSEEIILTKSAKLDFSLSEGVRMKEVVVESEKEELDKNVNSTQLGVVELPIEEVKLLPALFGEVDILKTMQLLPGVLSSGEGSAGFYVRGGGADQNLVLLDEAVVYNSGHLFGFFSVFNADAIKNSKLIKGGIPAEYGGRLSSVVDIQMKEGNDKNYQIDGGVGLISSKLTLQGPIIKNKSSFIVSARRTYVLDLLQPALKGSDFEGTNYYFYDLNAKVNYKISARDKIFGSVYFGKDVLNFNQPKRAFQFDLPYGNRTATLRWNHLYSDKLFSNFSLVYNDYDLSFDGGQEEFTFRLESGVRDYNLKLDFDYFPNNQHKVKYGLDATYHLLVPNSATASNGEVDFANNFANRYSSEFAAFLSDDWKISDQLSVHGGLRYSLYYAYNRKDRSKVEAIFDGLEPRLSSKYSFSKSLSIKAALTRTYQYLHLVTNSSSTLPTDIWVSSNDRIKPQYADQVSAGLFKNFDENTYETSVELYYKNLENQIDYREDYVNDLISDVEDGFVFGEGRAYGLELFARKNKGRFTGWFGLTLSKTERSFDDIQNGEWFNASYDRPIDLATVINFKASNKWNLSGTFIYGSGRNFTPYAGFFFIEQNLNVFYGPRNSARLEAYHRIDLSATYTPKPNSNRRFKSSWSLGIYNLYNRKNPFFIFFDTDVDSDNSIQLEANKVTLFPLIPSVTYNFSWK